MRISQETIDQIRLRADIVEVIGDFLPLKRRGKDFWAPCPFHNEKTPSFSVVPVKGIYKCFGCGAAGDAVKFVMDIEKVSYVESLKYLAKKYDIAIEESEVTSDEEQLRQNERDSLFIALNYAKNFYQEQLFESEEGKSIGLTYFKERGFNEKTIRDFELGYSQNSMDFFTKTAIKNGYTFDILEKSGLSIKKETGNPYDRFRDRVIFPIHNISGRVIAFGARILTSDKTQAKYINSPETDVYHKSQVLYGIFQAKNSVRQEDQVFLTEGYTDVISLHQAGIQNVVASSGTSLTSEQIRLVSRFTKNITLLYDGDPAGIKAALRGTDMILEEGLQVKIVTFPDNDDPDSFVKKVGSQAFKDFVKTHSQDLISFKTNLFLKEAQNDPFKKANVITEIVASISKIPDPIARAVFFKQTALQLEIAEETLISESNKILIKQRREKDKYNEKEPGIHTDFTTFEEETSVFEREKNNTNFESKSQTGEIEHNPAVYQEEETIRLLISYSDFILDEEQKLIEFILSEIEGVEFETPVYKQILSIIKSEFSKGKIPDTQYFTSHTVPEIQAEAIRLLTRKHDISENWEKQYQIVVPKEENMIYDVASTHINRLKQRLTQKLITDLMRKFKDAETESDQDKFMKMYKYLKDIEIDLAKRLGNVYR